MQKTHACVSLQDMSLPRRGGGGVHDRPPGPGGRRRRGGDGVLLLRARHRRRRELRASAGLARSTLCANDWNYNCEMLSTRWFRVVYTASSGIICCERGVEM
jgi:hypothetical protein